MVLDITSKLCKELSDILGRDVERVINKDNELRIIFKNDFNKELDNLIFKYAGCISHSNKEAREASETLLNIIQRDLDSLKISHEKFLRNRNREIDVYLWKMNIPNEIRDKVEEIMNGN